jgi:hypothetical protein
MPRISRTLDRISDRFVTEENTWALIALVAAVVGGVLGRTLLKSGWRASTGEEAPVNPDPEDVSWGSAITWAVVSGALVGILRTISRKGVSSIRHRRT